VVFSAGNKALLTDNRGRRYLITLMPGSAFHFHKGIVQHDQILGQPDGTTVRSSEGATLLVFSPSYADYILKMSRGAQVIYPKDAAMIAMHADLYPGARVLEAGIGSGAMTLAILRAVGSEGSVIAYELRPDFAAKARTNVEEFMGPASNFEIRLGSVYEAKDPEPVDRVVLDLPEPWEALQAVTKLLRPGGILASFLPTVLQVHQLRLTLAQDPRWSEARTIETLTRSWHVDGRSVRPDHRMVAHTGFVTTARLAAPLPEDPGPESEPIKK
jgi:tRNA (adenine57-N1/adenine58-N1)-methyltransferase catalytic subunit